MSLIQIPSSLECPRKNDPMKTGCSSVTSRKAGWYKIVHESGLACNWANDSIGGLDRLIEADWKAERFCSECIKKRQEGWQEKKGELWENLDEWLHLKETEAQVSTCSISSLSSID